MENKFIIHEAVIFNDRICRVEDIAVSADGEPLYLVQTPQHFYHWVPESKLERYIG